MMLYKPPPGTATLANVVSLLESRFPGFWRQRDSDDLPLPYLVFADFSRWLMDKMELTVEDT